MRGFFKLTNPDKLRMNIKEKKELLAAFIEKHVQCGYSIVGYMGKPLSYFDFEKLKTKIAWLNDEYQLEV